MVDWFSVCAWNKTREVVGIHFEKHLDSSAQKIRSTSNP